jgi:hypothetical protein
VFGGVYQIYMVWLALVGLGLFLHGLFSHELVEWAGAGLFLLAILVLVSGLPLAWHRPLLICTAGLGLPLLGEFLHWRVVAQVARTGRLFACVVAVLVASVLPAWLAVQWSQRVDFPDDIPVLSPQQPQQLQQRSTPWPRYLAVHVVAGTSIALELDIQGGVLQSAHSAPQLHYTMAQDLDLLLIDGKFSHFVRRAGQEWQNQDGWLRITRLDFEPDLGQGSGLRVRSSAQVELGGMP